VEPGATYVVEASPDLVHWEVIGITRIESAGTFDFEDFDSTKHPNRFYRAWKR